MVVKIQLNSVWVVKELFIYLVNKSKKLNSSSEFLFLFLRFQLIKTIDINKIFKKTK